MDIVGFIFLLLMILIGIALFLAFPVLSYFLYRHLRKKGKVQKNIGLTIFALTTIAMLILAIKTLTGPSGFGPEYETVEIEQNIGGKLICESVYNADIHSCQYNIDYKYIDSKGDTLDFTYGGYYGREWDKNEQIQKYNDWLILKTGSHHGSDRLIIKNIQTDSTKTYDINNDFIEQDTLWKAQNIKSLLNYCCAETFIDNIQGNRVLLTYRYRTDEKMTKKYGKRKIIYEIDNETGEIKMIDIK
jgi:heme/copper-type cytochrome/quinol oxidase subunit 2